MRRIQESIKLLLITNEDMEEANLNSLLNLVMNNEDCHLETCKQVYNYFQGNWSQSGFFKLCMFVLGEFCQKFETQNVSFTVDQVVQSML